MVDGCMQVLSNGFFFCTTSHQLHPHFIVIDWQKALCLCSLKINNATANDKTTHYCTTINACREREREREREQRKRESGRSGGIV